MIVCLVKRLPCMLHITVGDEEEKIIVEEFPKFFGKG